jgi:hypothetical protein
MKKTYIDQYVLCPFYSREESIVTRKIHCQGFKEGTHIHICFDKKDLKKAHKLKHCKDGIGYRKCPLYSVIAKQYQEVASVEK